MGIWVYEKIVYHRGEEKNEKRGILLTRLTILKSTYIGFVFINMPYRSASMPKAREQEKTYDAYCISQDRSGACSRHVDCS